MRNLRWCIFLLAFIFLTASNLLGGPPHPHRGMGRNPHHPGKALRQGDSIRSGNHPRPSGSIRHRDRPSTRAPHPKRRAYYQARQHQLREWSISYSVESEAGTNDASYQDLLQKASSLASRAKSLEEKCRVQNMFLQQAMRHRNYLQEHRNDPTFVVPEEIIVFLLDHEMTLPSPDQNGMYGPPEISGLLSLLNGYIADVNAEITKNTMQRNQSLGEYNASVELLLKRLNRPPRNGTVVILNPSGF